MSVQFNNPNGPGPLSKIIAFLVAVFTAFALFGFGVIVWVMARMTDGDEVDLFLAAVGVIT